MSEVEWHLSVLAWNIFVVLSQWVQLFVEIGVHDLVSKVVVGLTLMPKVLWHCGHIKIVNHFFNYIIY